MSLLISSLPINISYRLFWMQIFKFQRHGCKVSFLFPPCCQSALESLLTGYYCIIHRRLLAKSKYLDCLLFITSGGNWGLGEWPDRGLILPWKFCPCCHGDVASHGPIGEGCARWKLPWRPFLKNGGGVPDMGCGLNCPLWLSKRGRLSCASSGKL